jgi:hypothetical protein
MDPNQETNVTPDETPAETVPKDRLDAVLTEKHQLQETVTNLQTQMNLLAANQPQAPNQPQPQQKTEQVIEQLFEGVLTEDDPVPDAQQLRTVLTRFANMVGNALGGIGTMVQYPDYNEVVSKYLPEVVKKNPALGPFFRSGTQESAMAAYVMANAEKALAEKDKQDEQTPEVKAAIEAAKAADQPGSPSSVSSKATMDALANVKNMTDEEIEKKEAEVLARQRQ